jgi:hypothetical protein
MDCNMETACPAMSFHLLPSMTWFLMRTCWATILGSGRIFWTAGVVREKFDTFGVKKALLYSRRELDLAIEDDMRLDVVEERQKPKPPLPSERPRNDEAQADVMREEFSLRSIFRERGN